MDRKIALLLLTVLAALGCSSDRFAARSKDTGRPIGAGGENSHAESGEPAGGATQTDTTSVGGVRAVIEHAADAQPGGAGAAGASGRQSTATAGEGGYIAQRVPHPSPAGADAGGHGPQLIGGSSEAGDGGRAKLPGTAGLAGQLNGGGAGGSPAEPLNLLTQPANCEGMCARGAELACENYNAERCRYLCAQLGPGEACFDQLYEHIACAVTATDYHCDEDGEPAPTDAACPGGVALRKCLQTRYVACDGLTLLPVTAVCDGVTHCLDGSDETVCGDL